MQMLIPEIVEVRPLEGPRVNEKFEGDNAE